MQAEKQKFLQDLIARCVKAGEATKQTIAI